MADQTKSIEKSAGSVERAIELCLMELGVTRREVEVEILDDARTGFLGLGGRQARVRVRLLGDDEVDASLNRPAEKNIEEEDDDFEDDVDFDDDPEIEDDDEELFDDDDEDEDEEDEDEEPDALLDAVPEESTPNGEPLDEFDALPDPELMDELEIGEEILSQITHLLNLEVDISGELSSVDDLGKQAVEFNIAGSDANDLLGPRGDSMAELQYITRLMISQRLHRRSSVVIDIEGHRKKQRSGLEKLAKRMAQKVIKRQKPVTLEPMNPYERRLIHVALRNNKKVFTQSVGDGRQRRVRIFPEK
ncbi:MAG: RNA-binding cell elongation regulator Jag/EloR [Chloroflexota bacterium]